MAAFNLTAELNLRGPTNLNQVVGNIRRQLSTLSLNLNINPNTSRGIQAVTAEVRNLSVALRDAQANAVALSTTLRGLGATVSNLAGAAGGLTTINVNMNNLARTAGSVGVAARGATSEMSEFGRQSALAIRRFAAFSVATGAVYALSRAITSAYSEFVVFNKEFVRLQQVTDSTAAGLQSLSNEITRLSTGLGVSSQELLNVSVTLAQAGLSAGETKTALEALAKSALAPSFDNLNDTVEGSIALMRQFGISASDLESSLGSINAVAARFAVEASDLITAIQRTGGVFANASKGVSEGKDALNEFLAVFTSVRATTRESAETIATGLRTIFTRIQRGGTIDALKQYGIELTDLEGKFVGPYEAVRRLSEGLKALDPRDLRFSQIVEELGGFRQIGKVIPLIQQFETAQKALGVAQRGAGSLALDAATAQEALSVKINKVREQFIGLIRDIGQSQGFQTFVDISLKLASALITVADAAKDVLPALAAITAIRGVGALGQFFSGFAGGLGRRPRGFASGGLVPGHGNGDTVPAMLTPGEFVIRKKAVQTLGVGRLSKMNKYANGGEVQKFANAGPVLPSGRGKKGKRGARARFDLPQPGDKDYLEWVKQIYAEYDADPSLPRVKVNGVPTPPEIAYAEKLITKGVFERYGAGMMLGYDAKGNEVIGKFGKPEPSALEAKEAASRQAAIAARKTTSKMQQKLFRKNLEGIAKGSAAGLLTKEQTEILSPENLAAISKDPKDKVFSIPIMQKEAAPANTAAQTLLSTLQAPLSAFRKSGGKTSLAGVFPGKSRANIRAAIPQYIASLGSDEPQKVAKAKIALQYFDSFTNGAKADKPGHATAFTETVNQMLKSGIIQEFASGGFVQKFVKGGNIEDKINKNMRTGKKYEFGLVGLRSGTGSPIKPTPEPLDVTVGKEPNIKKYPVTLYKSTLSAITREQQEKTIENNIAASFGQMVEQTAASLRSILGGTKASSNKKQQILKGSPLTNVIGTVFEAALGFLGGPYIDKSEKTKSMDFPLGLGKAASQFSIKPNIPTDATRTIGGSGKGNSQMKKQIGRFITAVEKGEFTKSFAKFKENKLLERSRTAPSTVVSGYRGKVFDILKNNSVKDVLGPKEARDLATEIGVSSNKLYKGALVGEGKASLFGVLTAAGKDPEIAFKTIHDKLLEKLGLKKVKRAATGGNISGQDTVPALLTPGEFVINKKAAKRIGSSKLNQLNKADKVQGFNKGGFVGNVQKFAAGGMPARPTNANAFNVVVPNATIQALNDMAEALQRLGVSASSSAQLVSRGTAINIRESERAYQADLNRMRIAGAAAGDIYNMEQNLARVREINARKIDTSRELQGLSGGQLQDIQTRAERNRQNILRAQRARGYSEEDIATARNQERVRNRAFEDAGAAALGTNRRGLRARGMSGESIEQYVNQSMMNNRALRQMDAQLRQTREQELRNSAAYTSASASEQRRMMRELRARNNEEISERRNIARQLRADANLSGGGQFRTLGTISALFGMGELREDAFGMGPRRQRFARGLSGFNRGAQQAGFGLSFAGGMLGDTIGKAMGGKEGEAFGAAVSAFVGSAGIGAMFGPIGALTGVVLGATTAIQAWSDSIKDATIAEANKGVENASQKLQLSFNRLDKSTNKSESLLSFKDIAQNFEQILRYETEKRKAVVDKMLPDAAGTFEEGFFSGVGGLFTNLGRSLTGARTAGSWWDPTGYTGNLINPRDLMSGQIGSELVSSARQTNILQSLPQQFESAVAKGLSIKEVQSQITPQQMELFALATGDERLKEAITKREVLKEEKKPVPETLKNFINQLSTEIFNKEFLSSFTKTVQAQQAMEAASAAANIKINLLAESLKSIGAASSKAGAQFAESQRKIQLQAGSALGDTFKIQGPSRAQENILDNIQAYSVNEIRSVIGQIGAQFNFNPALTAEAQNAAANQRIIGEELPKILAEIAAKEGEGFDPAGDSATVIRKKLDEVFKTSITDPKQRAETVDRILKNIQKRLGSRKDITIGELAQDEAALADIIKGDSEVLKEFNNLLKQSNDVLGQVIDSMNGWVNSMNQATNMRVQAQTIGLTSRNDLAKALGESVSLREMNQPFDNAIMQLTQRIGAGGKPIAGTGTLDSNTIMARMIEKEKEAKDIQAQMEKEKPAIGSDRLKVLDEQLRRASLEARNLAQAHEKLQNDSTRASNALNKISELRQVQESRQNAFLDLIKSANDPEALINFTDEVGSFFAQMSGQGSIMNMEKAVAGLQRQLSVLSPEDQNRVRADFIDSVMNMPEFANMDRQMIDRMINAMGVGATVSPEMQALINEFTKYSNIQQEAIIAAAGRMEGAANTFHTEVVRAGQDFRTTVSGGGQANPVSVIPATTKQRGGMIYAAQGQYVNYQPRGTDTVPAMLTPGEFVVNAKATKKHIGLLHSINKGNFKQSGSFSSGGMVYMAGGGYVPVDTTIEADAKLLQEEKQRLKKPIEDQKDRIIVNIDALRQKLREIPETPEFDQARLNTQKELQPFYDQLTILNNQLSAIDSQFSAREEQIRSRKSLENDRRIAATGQLSFSDMQHSAPSSSEYPGQRIAMRSLTDPNYKDKLTPEEKQQVDEYERELERRRLARIQKAKDNVAKADAGKATATTNQTQQKPQAQTNARENLEKQDPKARALAEKEKRKQAFLAEKERKKQAFLASNPFARKMEEKKLARKQKEQDEAMSWSSTDEAKAFMAASGVLESDVAEYQLRQNPLLYYNKFKNAQRAQANRERLLFGAEINPADPDAQSKKDQAKAMSKEQMAEQAERRRGIDIAKRLGWTIKDDTVVGMDYGYYEGYEPGERPAAYDKLKPEDKAALEQYQSAEYSRIKAEKRASETAARQEEYAKQDKERLRVAAERDAKFEKEKRLRQEQHERDIAAIPAKIKAQEEEKKAKAKARMDEAVAARVKKDADEDAEAQRAGFKDRFAMSQDIARKKIEAKKAAAAQLAAQLAAQQAQEAEAERKAREKATNDRILERKRFARKEKEKGYLGYFAEGAYNSAPTRAVGEMLYGAGEIVVGGVVGIGGGILGTGGVLATAGSSAIDSTRGLTDTDSRTTAGMAEFSKSNLEASGAGFSTVGTGLERFGRALTFDMEDMKQTPTSALAELESKRAKELSNKPVAEIAIGNRTKIRIPSARQLFTIANTVRDEALGAAIPAPKIPGAAKAFASAGSALAEGGAKVVNQGGKVISGGLTKAGQGLETAGKRLAATNRAMSEAAEATVQDVATKTRRFQYGNKVIRIPEEFADRPLEYIDSLAASTKRQAKEQAAMKAADKADIKASKIAKQEDEEVMNIFEEIDLLENNPMQRSIIEANRSTVTATTKPTTSASSSRGGMDPRFQGESLLESKATPMDFQLRPDAPNSAAAIESSLREQSQAAQAIKQTQDTTIKQLEEEAAAKTAAANKAAEAAKPRMLEWSSRSRENRLRASQQASAEAQAAENAALKARLAQLEQSGKPSGTTSSPAKPQALPGTAKPAGKATLDMPPTKAQLEARARKEADRLRMEGTSSTTQQSLSEKQLLELEDMVDDVSPTDSAQTIANRQARKDRLAQLNAAEQPKPVAVQQPNPRPIVSKPIGIDPEILEDANRILLNEPHRFNESLTQAQREKLALEIAQQRETAYQLKPTIANENANADPILRNRAAARAKAMGRSTIDQPQAVAPQLSEKVNNRDFDPTNPMKNSVPVLKRNAEIKEARLARGLNAQQAEVTGWKFRIYPSSPESQSLINDFFQRNRDLLDSAKFMDDKWTAYVGDKKTLDLLTAKAKKELLDTNIGKSLVESPDLDIGGTGIGARYDIRPYGDMEQTVENIYNSRRLASEFSQTRNQIAGKNIAEVEKNILEKMKAQGKKTQPLFQEEVSLVTGQTGDIGSYKGLPTTRYMQSLLENLKQLKSKGQNTDSIQRMIDKEYEVMSSTFRRMDPSNFYNRGGIVYASKGTLVPYQPRGTDTVPAMLTPGEFVVNRKAAKRHRGILKAINNGQNIAPKLFNKGGFVDVEYHSAINNPNVGQPSSSSSGGVSIGVDTSSLDSVFSNFNSYVGNFQSVIGEFVKGASDLSGLSNILNSLGSLGLTESAGLMSNAGASVKDAAGKFSGSMAEFNTAATTLSQAIASIPKSIGLTVSGSIPVTVTVRIEGGINGNPTTADTSKLEQSIMDELATRLSEATEGNLNLNTRLIS